MIAPASGPPITTASTGSPGFAVWVDTFDFRRMGTSVPAGISAATAQAASRKTARLLFANFGNRAIDVLDSKNKALARFDPGLRRVETGRQHLVGRRARLHGVVHDQGFIEFLAEQRDGIKEPPRVGLRD